MVQQPLAIALTGLISASLLNPLPLLAQNQMSVALITDLEVLPGSSGLLVRLVSNGGQPQVFANVDGQTLTAEVSGAVSQLSPDRIAQRSTSRALQNLQIIQVGPDRLRITATVPSNTTVLATPSPRGVELQLISPNLAGQLPITPPGQVPPLIGRAIAPPLGDIAVSNVSVPGIRITFTNNQRISRLVLSNANVSDVLAMLARAARTNLVFQASASNPSATPSGSSTPGTGTSPAPAATAPISQKVSLDLANVSIEEAFNSIVSISGLQATRMGNTILVGENLPSSAVKLVSRTVRLNQAKATTASNYLNLQGAAVSTITVPRQFVPSGSGTSGSGTASGGSGTTVSSDIIVQESGPVITTLQPPNTPGVYYPLKGLTVASDERLNQVTIVGREELVKLAAEYLQQLDLRKRQVSINVKVVDLNLEDLNALNASFSFRVGDTFVTGNKGVLGLNLGPAVLPISPTPPGTVPITSPSQQILLGPQFLASINATIQNGNAKLLTDPTLIVQEGERSLVNITSQIVSKITCTTTTTNGGNTIAANPELVEAGLKLGVDVDRVDDNGFVTIQVTPDITAPLPQIKTGTCGGGIESFVTPLQKRSTASGRIRIRDGQTLVLSGVIQDSERNTSYKIPLLGDIPILGALFRGSETLRERREVIVVLTPRIIDDTQFSTTGYGISKP